MINGNRKVILITLFAMLVIISTTMLIVYRSGENTENMGPKIEKNEMIDDEEEGVYYTENATHQYRTITNVISGKRYTTTISITDINDPWPTCR